MISVQLKLFSAWTIDALERRIKYSSFLQAEQKHYQNPPFITVTV